jgi:hypothetical protein
MMDDEIPQTPDAPTSTPGSPAPGADGRMICPVCAAEYPAEVRFCSKDGSMLRSVSREGGDLVGSVVDERYYLLELVGQGGMGDVYLGEHLRTQRRCAVKLVSRQLARDPEAIGRFIREATNAGRINHPNVATIYDFGETEDGLLYIAMEYVDGEPLSRLLERDGALTPARAVEIARQVTEGVGAAHEMGIVHRDLKPGNIMIAHDRKGGDLVKVVDFGIARATEEEQRLTRTGLVVGTPEYMSPEQLIGDPVNARSDIYSLGCILYEMVTGDHAFGGTTARIITRRMTEPPPRPRDKNPAIPKALDELIVTAMGRNPQERFRSMEAMREALLAAPTGLVTTGPRRLAAWLGLGGGTSAEADEPDHGSDPAGSGGSRTDPTVPLQAAPPDAYDPVTPAPLAAVPATEAFDSPGDVIEVPAGLAGAEEGEGLPSSPDLETEALPRRRVLRPVTIGVPVLVLLLVAAATLFGPERGSRDEPEAAAHDPATAGPEPPVQEEPEADVPDPVLLDAIRAGMVLAEEDRGALRFAAAIRRLQALDSRLAAMAAEYPGDGEIRILADSAGSDLARVENQCNALRQVALLRNETPPVCGPED